MLLLLVHGPSSEKQVAHVPLGEGRKRVTLMAKTLKLTKGRAWNPLPTGSPPRTGAASARSPLTPYGAHGKALLTGLPVSLERRKAHAQLLSTH